MGRRDPRMTTASAKRRAHQAGHCARLTIWASNRALRNRRRVWVKLQLVGASPTGSAAWHLTARIA